MATIELNQQPNITVVVVPFPAQGHLNQLLHLSRLIAGYNIPVHVITTTTHNRQAQTRIPLPPTIHFHHYPTPTSPHRHPTPPPPSSSLHNLYHLSNPPCISASILLGY
ncbi:putative trans-zeatin O-beta-D-glucosyltransferase [Helianthus annuus]|nr:putative trans-zeatin O-beta-D-glucosyltransferase [Helianthus annuus]